jgi:molecular chaperone DnaK (HSP70)
MNDFKEKEGIDLIRYSSFTTFDQQLKSKMELSTVEKQRFIYHLLPLIKLVQKHIEKELTRETFEKIM